MKVGVERQTSVRDQARSGSGDVFAPTPQNPVLTGSRAARPPCVLVRRCGPNLPRSCGTQACHKAGSPRVGAAPPPTISKTRTKRAATTPSVVPDVGPAAARRITPNATEPCVACFCVRPGFLRDRRRGAVRRRGGQRRHGRGGRHDRLLHRRVGPRSVEERHGARKPAGRRGSLAQPAGFPSAGIYGISWAAGPLRRPRRKSPARDPHKNSCLVFPPPPPGGVLQPLVPVKINTAGYAALSGWCSSPPRLLLSPPRFCCRRLKTNILLCPCRARALGRRCRSPRS